MFNTIIVGTDGSSNAERAVRIAADLAKTIPGCTVHVVAAYRPLSGIQIQEIANALPDEFRDTLHADYGVDSILDAARFIFKKAAVDAEFHGVNNDPTEAILGAAERYKADLIIVGSRGENAAQRMLHGSVSTKLVHNTPCSVLVVRDED